MLFHNFAPNSNHNFMKPLIKLIAILLISVSCTGNVLAEKRNSETNDLRTTYLRFPRDPKRPKAPSMIYLICQYSTAYISLSFPEDANYMEISLSDETGPVWIGSISRTNPETEIPVLSGEYTITCQTDQNQIFEGTLLFTN